MSLYKVMHWLSTAILIAALILKVWHLRYMHKERKERQKRREIIFKRDSECKTLSDSGKYAESAACYRSVAEDIRTGKL